MHEEQSYWELFVQLLWIISLIYFCCFYEEMYIWWEIITSNRLFLCQFEPNSEYSNDYSQDWDSHAVPIFWCGLYFILSLSTNPSTVQHHSFNLCFFQPFFARALKGQEVSLSLRSAFILDSASHVLLLPHNTSFLAFIRLFRSNCWGLISSLPP